MKQRLKNGDEWDAVYARRMYCYLQHAGVASRIKRWMRRRIRHEAQGEIERELRDDNT
jgi:hypothetical protein